MFNSFSAALSALKAHSTAVDAVGQNLANVNTTGYKAIDVAFKDLVAQSMNGSSETGLGVGRALTVRTFNQGSITSSSGSLDAAIQGNGFFVVQEENSKVPSFTRDGGFKLDAKGFVVTLTGEKVMQYSAAGLQPIQVPTGSVKSTPTTEVDIVANLNASAPTGPTAVGSTFSNSIEVVDSLGARHSIKFQFTKTGDNTWDADVLIPAVDVGGLATDPPTSIGKETITFDSSGKLATPALPTPPAPRAPIPIIVPGLTNQAADLAISWDLYDEAGAAKITQFSQSSAASKAEQNGFVAAEVTSVGMADGGRVMARFGSGEEREIAKLAIALIANPSSMSSVSNNNYRVTGASAAPVFGTAETGGRGKVTANTLEASTVDIAREFTNLIVYQRGYQANSRVITTTDELTQETLNLKR